MLRLVSPVDGSLVAEREPLPAPAARERVSRAREAQRQWAARPLAERIAIVRAGVDALCAQSDEAVPELARMMGRPVRYGGEFGGVAERAHFMAGIAQEALGPHVVEDSGDFERRIEREPHGVVLVIAPWNYPYLTAINALAPALVAGNAVALKPATQTLLAGERTVAAFRGAGVPEALLPLMLLDHATTEALIGEGLFDFVNFTGSVAGGRAIERAAAGTFTGTGLELGGKDPGYVMDDADLDAAADTLVDAAMFNSGQCCCGIERIYVTRARFDAFVERAVAIASDYRLGDPLDPETTLGPMANARTAQVVRAQVRDAVAAGARALIDPARFALDRGEGTFVAPQVLVDVDHSMELMREENFGPVVGIMAVEDDEEAVALMNDSPYGLTASLWTADAERAARIGARIDTGTVFMNRADYLDPGLCWSGRKDTGRGASLSVLGFHALTRPKSFHLKKR